MATNYFDSGNRYTDPVRYFKANDPYYYEVDNIPIKQLEENTNFLKDQVDGLVKQTRSGSFSRSRFTELQPYTDQVDSTVNVMSGRFSARINDAITLTKLQFISQVFGVGNSGEPNTFQIETNIGPNVGPLLDKWQSKVVTHATQMNGLFERVFVWPMLTSDIPATASEQATAGFFGGMLTSGGTYGRGLELQPGYQGQIWMNRTNQDNWYYSQYGDPNANGTSVDLAAGFRQAGRLESEFIKRWRGVSRIAIVDVPSELQIEIPKFESSDFFYVDAYGDKQTVPTNQRIDLLFIYAKPVDMPSTKIPSYAGYAQGQVGPRTLTEPTLGIVKGAGIGLDTRTSNTFSTSQNVVRLQSEDGVTLMLPNPSEDLVENTGFQTSAGLIRGSFPSPDDLMNLAPLLSENLAGGDITGEQDSIALIGQSILPIAYIVVKDSASINENGAAIITGDDIIDIRPFFRTAELAYNERSGIAAATPQVSLANPVATEATLEKLRIDLHGMVGGSGGTSLSEDRVVGAGTIKGGMFYGVEGALATWVREKYNIQTWNSAKARVETEFGYPTNSIQDLPDWDIAKWCDFSNLSHKGEYPNDRVNYFQWGLNSDQTPTRNLPFAPFEARPAAAPNMDYEYTNSARIPRLSSQAVRQDNGFNNILNTGSQANMGITAFYFVKKTIMIDRMQIPWASDYIVDVQLQNCAPLCSRGVDHHQRFKASSSTASIWVDKRPDEFTIFISWASDDKVPYDANGQPVHTTLQSRAIWDRLPSSNREKGKEFAGFAVMPSTFVDEAHANGFHGQFGSGSGGFNSTTAGVAIYPTVSFKITGISQGIQQETLTSLNSQNPVITLR